EAGEEARPPEVPQPPPEAPAAPVERPPAPTGEEYVTQAMRNLAGTSRTAAGVLDVSSTPGKTERLVEGLDAKGAQSAAVRNFETVVRGLYAGRDAVPATGADMSAFIDDVATRINDGIVKPEAI